MRRHQKKDMDAMRRGNAMRQWTAAGCRKKNDWEDICVTGMLVSEKTALSTGRRI